MTQKPIQAGMTLVREPRPAQYALSGSALEWEGYKASCVRVQQSGAFGSSAADRSKNGSDASTPGP